MPAHRLLAQVRAWVTAARVIPGVWGVLRSNSTAGTILTPFRCQSMKPKISDFARGGAGSASISCAMIHCSSGECHGVYHPALFYDPLRLGFKGTAMVDPALGVVEYAMQRKDKDLRGALAAANYQCGACPCRRGTCPHYAHRVTQRPCGASR